MGTAVRIVAVAIIGLALIAGIATYYVLGTRHGQDFALQRATAGIFARVVPAGYDGLRVFVCGSGSPLPGRAQACVAVTAGESLYLVDSGAGSPAVMQVHGQPMAHLRAVLLTHLHSDHITRQASTGLSAGTTRFSPWIEGSGLPITASTFWPRNWV
ncbi:MAG: MBL fold metallo-hydrolase [Gammaproteobacteria bacterium]|nr:MBL fold metallo-hydrolase [Gammaproteobacteria bacterium]